MTEAELRHFGMAIAQVALIAGFVGGMAWSLVREIVGMAAEAFMQWEERRNRALQARMRNQCGPLLLPGLGSRTRRGFVRLLRRRHAEQAANA